tara:strand:+ start:402 stop:560 length:159 start_codon:yes stop_codon:yes gene_type:complete
MNATGLENPCKVGGIVLRALARTVEWTITESIGIIAPNARRRLKVENYFYFS